MIISSIMPLISTITFFILNISIWLLNLTVLSYCLQLPLSLESIYYTYFKLCSNNLPSVWVCFLAFSLSLKPEVSKLIFSQGLDSKYFWLQGPDGLCHNHSTLPLYCESNQGQYMHDQMCCVSVKLLVLKQMEARFGPPATVCQPLFCRKTWK